MKVRTVAFRVDASVSIGMGHVMRCLALAIELRCHGVQCIFLCRPLPGHAATRIGAEGFGVVLLEEPGLLTDADGDSPERHDGGADDWKDDVRATVAALGGLLPDWIVVDHYSLDYHWEIAMESHCAGLMAIDDLADRRHRCSMLLDHNLGRTEGDYADLVPEGTILLIGPKFAPLRPEFARVRASRLRGRTSNNLRHILVGMGGTDPGNATSIILNSLRHWQGPADPSVTVLLGRDAPHLVEVQMLCESMPFTCIACVDPANMAEQLARSDLAIGAGGVSALERCCMGLPSIVVILAENQRSGSRELLRQNAIGLIGSVDEIPEALPGLLERFSSPGLAAEVSFAASQVTDGKGAARVVAEMVEFPGKPDSAALRPMTPADLDIVLAWRNHPDIRRYMFRTSVIDQAEHERWFRSAVSEPGRHLMIFSVGGVPSGFLNLGPAQDGAAKWGFYVAPGASKGTGRLLGQASLDLAFRVLGLRKVCGEAFAFNKASIGFHISLGFSLENVIVEDSSCPDPSRSLHRFGLLAERWASVNERAGPEHDS